MSTGTSPQPPLRPRGRLPARVYWVRRGLVLAAAFLLVFGIARLLGAGSDGDDGTPKATQAAGEQSSQSDGNIPVGVPNTMTESAQEGNPKNKPARTELPDPTGPCDPTDLTVSAAIEEAEAGDGKIAIPFEVSGAEPACTFQVSDSSVAVKITSGSDLIWTNQQCSKVIPTKSLVVRAAKPAKWKMIWNGRRSTEECGPADWALPGIYHVDSAALGGEPSDQRFELVIPDRETITKAPKKEKKSDEDETGLAEEKQKKDRSEKKDEQQNRDN